jgi:hypothetical protein
MVYHRVRSRVQSAPPSWATIATASVSLRHAPPAARDSRCAHDRGRVAMTTQSGSATSLHRRRGPTGVPYRGLPAWLEPPGGTTVDARRKACFSKLMTLHTHLSSILFWGAVEWFGAVAASACASRRIRWRSRPAGRRESPGERPGEAATTLAASSHSPARLVASPGRRRYDRSSLGRSPPARLARSAGLAVAGRSVGICMPDWLRRGSRPARPGRQQRLERTTPTRTLGSETLTQRVGGDTVASEVRCERSAQRSSNGSPIRDGRRSVTMRGGTLGSPSTTRRSRSLRLSGSIQGQATSDSWCMRPDARDAKRRRRSCSGQR